MSDGKAIGRAANDGQGASAAADQSAAAGILQRIDDLLGSIATAPAAARASPRGFAVVAAARAERQARSERGTLFGASLLRNPAWDILLELFIMRGEERAVTVAGLCRETKIAEEVMLRCLAMLIEEGLVGRRASSNPREKPSPALSEHGLRLMVDYFSRSAKD